MNAWCGLLGVTVFAVGVGVACAQTPVLGSIEAPYADLQSTVTIAGATYGPGAVAYGSAGTPLVVTGSGLGGSGTVQFIAYKNGAVDTSVSPVQATLTTWSLNMLNLTVPADAKSGLVKVTVGGKTSNGLPFIVTPGSYSSSCPAGPLTTQLQITTASLHDGTVGQAYSAMLGATGGTTPYSWSITSGTLPGGLALNASTGTISGTPTAASGQVDSTFQVTDSSSPKQTNDAVLSITVSSQALTPTTVYSYVVAQGEYDGVGNVLQYQDSVMGSWNFTYDTLNRLSSAVPGAGASGAYAGQNLCMAYDAFGNRTAQNFQTAACPAQESSVSPAMIFSADNRIPDALYVHDAAGDVTSDPGHDYLYDAEGRICSVSNKAIPGTTGWTAYIYDADGVRVAKGSISVWSCDAGTNGFQTTNDYILGPSSEQMTEMVPDTSGTMTWKHTNVWAGGKLLATYDSSGLHFYLNDPLGTRRVQTDYQGVVEQTCASLPYGDGESCLPSPTEHLFTGKERDSESGNDYFGARYYSSAMGRFMSPDWSAKEEPVPYAKLDDPQSLNLYAYVRNNPLTRVDLDGHCISGPDANPLGCGSPMYRTAPTLPNGQPAPPNIPVPGGSGAKWKWNANPKNSRGGSWGPDKWDGKTQGSPPSASWDAKPGKNGTEHWDVDDGKGGRTRVDENGKPLTPDEAHGKSPMQSLQDGVNGIGQKIGDWEYQQWQGIKNELNKMPGGSNYHPSPTTPFGPVPIWETE